ncbi:type II toxin-antitoxin system HipA family toxin [Cryobacterium arcticum]|uniref:HipA-like C-terminal domain-containing protein n=1 Tax=Cryobacterium arcticum TaxID=670052 RepID=A0A1B1BKG5_9MICO|nr:HipA domain-containing protein [Cryobacterium arcticum]ANP73031.1 hypothetical protein PA27867_2079 [Cryobacterium arcticum]
MSNEQVRLIDAVDVYLDESPERPESPESAGAPLLIGALRASFGAGRQLGGSSFEYTAEYLASPSRYAISPDLPLVAGKQFSGEDAALFGAFADATPDDWGTGLIDAAFTRERGAGWPLALGEFDHLVQQNDLTRMGALRFREPGTSGTSAAGASTPGTSTAAPEWLTAAQHTAANPNDAQRIAEAVARFEEYEATDEDMEILGYAGSSLGGARPKATIQDADGGLWLLKLPSNRDRRIDTEAWEATALDLAAAAGLRVPRHRLIRLDEHKSSLLIERFDRRFDQRSQSRVGYMSAMTAMQLGPQQSATYEDLADTIDQVTLESSVEDLREMFGRVALTVLVGNVDDHWKNHGFTRERTGVDAGAATSWRLSPAFDVNPTRPGSRVRSRRINSHDDPSNRDVRLLIEGRDAYRLTQRDAAEVLARVTRAVGTWRETARKYNIGPGEIEYMAPAFNEAQFEYAERFVIEHLAVTSPRVPPAVPPVPAIPRAGQPLADRKRRFPELFAAGEGASSSPDASTDLEY